MQFDLRAKSPDMIAPAYNFPEDEVITPETYRNVVCGGYVSTTVTLYGAARAIGLEVDTETFERWKRIGAAAGLLDDFLDESPYPEVSQQMYDQVLAGQIDDNNSHIPLPPFGDARLEPAVNMMRTSTNNLPEFRRQKLIAAARNIGHIAITKSTASSLEAYTNILRQEALETSALIRYSASE